MSLTSDYNFGSLMDVTDIAESESAKLWWLVCRDYGRSHT